MSLGVNMIAVDLYFLMNAAYDLTLLCVVGIIAKKRLCFGRVLAASLLGAVWSVIALVVALYFVLPSFILLIGKLITYLLCPYLMCRIAYRGDTTVAQKKVIRQTTELLLYFYIVGALISGLMLLLKWSGIRIPSWILMPVCGMLAAGIWRYLTKREEQKNQIYEVTITYHGKTFCIKALYDSGNTLMTMKGELVHVLAPSIWKELIGEEPWQENGFAIPYQTVSEVSVMPGIYLDEVSIAKVNKQEIGKEVDHEGKRVLKHIVAALGSMELGDCQMLLHRDTFNEIK